MAYIGRQPTVGNFRICDAISVVNGQAAYTMQVGGVNVIPESANNMIVSLNGVIQKPGSSYTVSSSTITFSSNLSTGDVIDFIQILGGVANIGTPTDGTVTSAKISYPLTTFSSTGIDDNAGATAITIDSSGNVGIGNTVASTINSANGTGNLVVGSGSGTEGITIYSGTTGEGTLQFADGTSGSATYVGQINYSHSNNDMSFTSGGTERMRLLGTGNVGIGTSSPGCAFEVSGTASLMNNVTRVSANYHQIADAGANTYTLKIHNKATSTGAQYINEVAFTAANPDNNTARFFNMIDNSAVRCDIYSDGDIKNHDNSYGSLSDERIKQNIVDSGSQWDDIKAVKVRKFKKKDDVRQYGDEAWVQIGVIAQELEAAGMDKLIRHSEPSPSDILSDSTFGTLYEDGDEIPEGKAIGDIKEIKAQVKGVGYSVLYMKAIKALQEAMTRIETLEAEVTALKNQP
tara:strand:+ start:296 stop:1678 length:1383 start_codon:yes stop_codon:yes gene_type:complete